MEDLLGANIDYLTFETYSDGHYMFSVYSTEKKEAMGKIKISVATIQNRRDKDTVHLTCAETNHEVTIPKNILFALSNGVYKIIREIKPIVDDALEKTKVETISRKISYKEKIYEINVPMFSNYYHDSWLETCVFKIDELWMAEHNLTVCFNPHLFFYKAMKIIPVSKEGIMKFERDMKTSFSQIKQ